MALKGHKLYGFVLIALLLAVLAALPGSLTFAQMDRQQGCGNPVTGTLWAGQTTDAGTVTVWNDANHLYVQFQTTGGWVLTQTHVHVATSLSGIPTNDQGVPVPGQFDYSTTHNNVTTYTYFMSLAWPDGTDLVIAAHAVVALLDGSGNAVQTETAWGGGKPGGGSRWWFYLEYTTQTCEEEDEPTSGGSGCTPGYWRNHTDDWAAAGYQPTQTVGSLFGAAPAELTGDSLHDAVQYRTQSRGRDSVVGAARTLLRAGVAALLNASHPDVDYPRSAGAVINDINAALASGDRNTILSLAEVLDDDNNLGCPLSGTNTRNPGGGKPDKPGGKKPGGGKPDNPGSQGQGRGRGNSKNK